MQQIRSEQDIIAKWDNPENIIVSIICTTYNHENFIEDAIHGFLIQDTPFAFEIIIHDDASTDATVEIVNKYLDTYPRIFKTIFQKVNQYSQKKKATFLAAATARGKYLAFCEGDDYWIDPFKIKKQVHAMVNDSTISMTIHRALIRNNNSTTLWKETDKGSKECFFNCKDIILHPNQFAPTASYVIQKEVIDKLPSWFSTAPIGDFFIEMYSQKVGRGLYLPDTMSVYRQDVGGSWTNTVLLNPKKRIYHSEKLLECHNKLKLDFPELNESDFYNREEKIHKKICLSLLKMNDFDNFRSTLNILKKKYRIKGIAFKILYMVQKHDWVIKFFCKILVLRMHLFKFKKNLANCFLKKTTDVHF